MCWMVLDVLSQLTIMSYDLLRFPAYHHNVNIFVDFHLGLILQKPVQLIHFHKFCVDYGFLVTPLSGALFIQFIAFGWICSLIQRFFFVVLEVCRDAVGQADT